VPDDVWARVTAVWSQEEVADLIIAIATINVWNRIGVATRMSPPRTIPAPGAAGWPVAAS
jgi:alkylhydroperoxidase family enzyme